MFCFSLFSFQNHFSKPLQHFSPLSIIILPRELQLKTPKSHLGFLQNLIFHCIVPKNHCFLLHFIILITYPTVSITQKIRFLAIKCFFVDLAVKKFMSSSEQPPRTLSQGPFAGLVICVTGLSKEARKQVKDATESLGGQYSPNLHPQCTHLIVQSFVGRKLEHALKHGSRNGLYIVTLGWFVDSVRRNVRLSESLYYIKNVGDSGMHFDHSNRLVGFTSSHNSCFPVGNRHTKQPDLVEEPHSWFCRREPCQATQTTDNTLCGYSFYLDPDISAELRNKVTEAAVGEGATTVDKWFVGCKATHVVCEGSSVQKYLGHSENIVTPLWVLKTANDKHMQRLLHISADLGRQIKGTLEHVECTDEEGNEKNDLQHIKVCRTTMNHEARQQIADLAKTGVRNRRSRQMQTCQNPLRPITPSTLLDSVCWSISEPPSAASIYTDCFSAEDDNGQSRSIFFDAKEDGKDSEASFANLTRPLKESEKNELIFRHHFLTILFPIDRFAELGPSSRTFFSDKGFTCLQVLDHIYGFYQENMSIDEIEVAIHTDSRHADRLRLVYSGKETSEHRFVVFKRFEFLGSRKSFEMLKRVSGDNNSNVYELLVRA